MKKGTKILALFLLSIVFTSLAMSFVSAAITDTIKTNFESLFGSTLGIADGAIIKFLVWILIFLIVLAVSESLPFLEGENNVKPYLRYILSAIIAYLSVAFLTPGELYSTLQSYSALGVTLTAIIPFAIILTVAWRLSTNPTPANIVTQKLALGIFAAFLTYKTLYLISEQPADVWGPALAIYISVAVITVLMIVFNATIRKFILGIKVEGYIAQSEMLSKAEILARIGDLDEKIQQSLKAHGTPRSEGGPNEFVDALINAKKTLERYATHAK